jgi:hypothetical protein
MRGVRRLIFWLLVLELIVAFAAATAIQHRLAQPARYIGSAIPAGPDEIGEPGTPVLDAGQHEEQVA